MEPDLEQRLAGLGIEHRGREHWGRGRIAVILHRQRDSQVLDDVGDGAQDVVRCHHAKIDRALLVPVLVVFFHAGELPPCSGRVQRLDADGNCVVEIRHAGFDKLGLDEELHLGRVAVIRKPLQQPQARRNAERSRAAEIGSRRSNVRNEDREVSVHVLEAGVGEAQRESE